MGNRVPAQELVAVAVTCYLKIVCKALQKKLCDMSDFRSEQARVSGLADRAGSRSIPLSQGEKATIAPLLLFIPHDHDYRSNAELLSLELFEEVGLGVAL